jgi:hypothetical protein
LEGIDTRTSEIVPQSDNFSPSELPKSAQNLASPLQYRSSGVSHGVLDRSQRREARTDEGKLGPMKAIDVLRRAQGATKVYNGETWFTIGDGPDAGDASIPDTSARDSERIVIRKAG